VPLWDLWLSLAEALRPAFGRETTFLWFLAALSGLAMRPDALGVTSFVRSLRLRGSAYHGFRRFFHSRAMHLDDLTRRWVAWAFRAFEPVAVTVDGKRVLVCDGLKAPKEGKKMPAVKSLHQESTNNSKPEYIMGHSFQVVSVLVRAAHTLIAVPLAGRIHEGLVFTNRDRRTLLDHMVELLESLAIPDPFYLLADAYYACRKISRWLVRCGGHLVCRVRITAVGYLPATVVPSKARKRGRPRIYGPKIRLRTLFDDPAAFTEAPSPVADEPDVTIRYRSFDLIWRPLGKLARFVLVEHPRLGKRIFFSTDLTRGALEILTMYSWRFKIELSFRQAIHVLGTYAYHFWMKAMKPLRRGSGDQYLHRTSDAYRAGIRRKLAAYHLHVQLGLIAQGLMNYLSAVHPTNVWQSFYGWIRTIRPGIPPSELVVAQALRDTFPEFLEGSQTHVSLKKFLAKHRAPRRPSTIRLAM
jgi:hypothetical protein